MSISKRYNAAAAEPQLAAEWQETAVYQFDRHSDAPVYSIDTPPPTVSGRLHLGHVFSYSHTDFIARFWRMNGHNVFYPLGFDDNGLPTGRLVERHLGKKAQEIGREEFIRQCLAFSEEAEAAYRALWTRLGLSIDWRYTYRTIGDQARRVAQLSFLDLLEKGLAYRQQAPAIWCPECRTSLAQADLDDLERETTFHTLAFTLADGQTLPIATTRPELLPACVAVFVHPQDGRYAGLTGASVTVPLFGQEVPLLADPAADPQKGTGAVMCCTFGDTTDITWWRVHQLPLVEAIARDGRLTGAAGAFAGQPAAEARRGIVAALEAAGLLLDSKPETQSVPVHERCDTPIEYVMTHQWFIRILDHKEAFLAAGDSVAWHPPHMAARYRQWVENLSWDWGISRQRYFGVPFPVWYCDHCGGVIPAPREALPVDPSRQPPPEFCPVCGGESLTADQDVMDTWATSSMSPQIAGRWLEDEGLYNMVFPFSCRPQAHEIIRTWAFYTIVKSIHHFQTLPWQDAMISGWALAPEGTAKLSKSRGGGPVEPLEMIERYSADAVRYWAASTGLGKDAVIDEQRIQAGAKWVTKLWNVSRFCQPFLRAHDPRLAPPPDGLSPADRWILARTQALIERSTALWRQYDYASARSELEVFFWRDLADNYLEMVKKRLYDDRAAGGAQFALYQALLSTIKLLAPVMPYVTERIYQGLFAATDGAASVHRARWPQADPRWPDSDALQFGGLLLDIATAVRRFKSESTLSLGSELRRLELATGESGLAQKLQEALLDLSSVTRANEIVIGPALSGEGLELAADSSPLVRLAVVP